MLVLRAHCGIPEGISLSEHSWITFHSFLVKVILTPILFHQAVCIYVYMYDVCMYDVCMYDVCMYVCSYVCMYVCI